MWISFSIHVIVCILAVSFANIGAWQRWALHLDYDGWKGKENNVMINYYVLYKMVCKLDAKYILICPITWLITSWLPLDSDFLELLSWLLLPIKLEKYYDATQQHGISSREDTPIENVCIGMCIGVQFAHKLGSGCKSQESGHQYIMYIDTLIIM